MTNGKRSPFEAVEELLRDIQIDFDRGSLLMAQGKAEALLRVALVFISEGHDEERPRELARMALRGIRVATGNERFKS